MCAQAEPFTAADSQPSASTLDNDQIQGDDEINWDDPEYRTAEFRMFCFKVLPCTKPHHEDHAHHWTNCPYAHVGEHACRRDPRKFNYAAVVCPDLLQGGHCPRGETCDSAHSVFEFWLHPQRYRTQICREGPGCRRRVCFFAHSEDELREVQLPPVEGDPFAAANAAKYSMSSIPSSARKQLNRSSSAPSKPTQGGGSTGSPTVGAAAAPQSAVQLGAAGVAAAAAAGVRGGCSRSASDTAALMRSGSATAASFFQQQDVARMGGRPGAASSSAFVAAARRGNPHRLSMDSAAWSNYAAVHADARTKRRHSVDAAAAARAAAAANSGSTHNSGSYACASTSCSILPTMHMALQPQLVQLPRRPPAGWEMLSPMQGGSSNMAAAAASPGGSLMLLQLQQQQQQQQQVMMSPQQLQLQLMQLQLQQQHTGCMTDVSTGSRPLDVSTTSLASATSMGPVQRQASLMRQFSIDSARSGSGLLPQLIQQQQQQQDAALDAAVAAGELLQLVSADGLSLNPAGPYVTSGRSGSSGRVAAASRPAGEASPAAAAAGGSGARLSVVPEGAAAAAAAAAAAGMRPGSGGGSGVSVTAFRDGSSSNTNSSISCPYAAAGVISPGCTSLASAEGWSPAVVSASPGMVYNTAQPPMQQQQYVAGSPAVPAAPLNGLTAQLQQMQLSGASPASINELLASYSAQAEITRKQAALAQAAADAASDRLMAYIAALGSSSSESMAANAAACSSVFSAGMNAPPHAQQQQVMQQMQPAQQQQQQQQMLRQQQQQQQQQMLRQQQQQMLQSDQLMILLDDQAAAAAAAGAPMLTSQGSAGQQQQYVLHSTPQASADSLMAHHIPTTSWM